LVGDHLYSKSFALLVRDNDRAIMETLARATVSMTEAEVYQLQLKRSGLTSEADYVRIITQKTASFMSACCRIGALLGGLHAQQLEALTRYGLDIGVAFQMSDDSLDFVADERRLGKAIAADLREGKRTLPLIAMLERVSEAEAERVRAMLRRRALLRAGGQARPEGVRPVRGARAPDARRRFRRRSRPVTAAPIVTLTTDFGTRDAYVAAMKGVILGIAPDARLVDVSHEVTAHDVTEGALALEAAVPFFPAGTVHLAVVDPGVGTARRGLAIVTEGATFVGPDNGLFTPFLEGR